MLPVRTRRSAGLFIITLSMLLALVVAAPVAAKNPAGNNGTVKIDGLEWDNHPDNEPHVGCTFEVDFYGFDEGDLWADVIFEAHPPTGHGVLLTEHDLHRRGRQRGRRQRGRLGRVPAVRPHGGARRLPGPSPAGLPRQADDPRRWFAGRRHEAQGLLGGTLRARARSTHVNPPRTRWPGDPPNDGAGSGSQPPGEGTAGGNPDPGMLLPDTAMDPASASLALLAGALLLGGSAGLAVVEVRRARSRRR